MSTTTKGVRLRIPQRTQVRIMTASLDQMLGPDSPARTIWSAVCSMDLSAWLNDIKAVEGGVGRNATDPKLLLALWVFATVRGIGSSRELTNRCHPEQGELAFQWMCGEVTVNRDMLCAFRAQSEEKLDQLLTQIVAALMNEGLVTLDCVAQDGMRVRASAGKSSFRRKPSLDECLTQAREQLEALKRLTEEDPASLSTRQQAARKRALQEKEDRIKRALEECEKLEKQRAKRDKERLKGKREGKSKTPRESRGSTTDPDARVMQFSDGGFRPGCNIQFGTDTGSGIITGVDVTNVGNDFGQLPPMLDQHQQRYGRCPNDVTLDGGYVTKDSIEQAATDYSVRVFAPVKDAKKQQDAGKDPYVRKRGDSDAVASWRERMGAELAETMKRLRCQTAEWVNALCRNRNLWQMPLRGRSGWKSVSLLYAITHNIVQSQNVRATG